MNKLSYQRYDFIEYLKETLIPDLKESGKNSTANDFELAVLFMENSHICWAEIEVEEPGLKEVED